MSEELLKAIIQLFAIVAKERITDDERANIKEFLSLHLNQEAIRYYLNLFDEFVKANRKAVTADLGNVDEETLQFVDDWAKIMQISKKVNQALTMQQKAVLVVKIIELIFADGQISERQENLIFYIGEALKIPLKDLQAMRTFVIGQDSEERNLKNILIIDEGSGGHHHSGPHIVPRNLTGLIGVLRLAEVETYFVKYLGITSLYLNSQQLKSRKVDVLPTGSTIRGSKIEPIYYSDNVGKFLFEESDTEISFIAEHIFYHFKSGRAGLQNVTISEKGGKLIGLMGASGSGKSTLLNVLNGTEKPSSGRVLINGIDIHEYPDKVEGVVGFIRQDDLLIEDLTVYENLYFAARLCFGHFTPAQINERVERVLMSLGISETKDLKVGSPLQKTISGGQRKRVNIGLELLREPAVLFVDEPTSGLSSRDSENIIDLLKELALKGKLVFAVIHQPSSDIFKMFDRLVILDTGGYQIYYGNPVDAVIYFKQTINLVNSDQGECAECGNVNPEQIFNIIETKVIDEFGNFTNERKISAELWNHFFKEKHKPRSVKPSADRPISSLHLPNWLKQASLFGKRDSLSKLSNRQDLAINLLEAPLLAFILAFITRYYNTDIPYHTGYIFSFNLNLPAYLFMSVIVALFMGLTVSAEEIIRDQKILKREEFLHLSRSSYLVSKMSILFMISAIQTFLFVMVGNGVLEIKGMFLTHWAVLFTVSCFANILGLNISSAFNSAVTIYILIPILLIPQLILSGVAVKFDKLNPLIGNSETVPFLGDLMTSRWAFEAAMVAQFKDNRFEREFYEMEKTIAQADYKKLYYIPTLESKLAFVSLNYEKKDADSKEIAAYLHLMQREINQELAEIGNNHFPEVSQLHPGSYDSAVYSKTRN